VSVTADSIIKPKFGIGADFILFFIFYFYFFKNRNIKKRRKETNENGKVIVIGVNKANNNSKGPCWNMILLYGGWTLNDKFS
jgi:hypothetical protein